MARGVLTVQQLLKSALSPTLAAASTYTDGDSFVNDGNTFLWVKNSGSVLTVTVSTAATYGGYALADQTFTIASTDGNGKFIGPFDPKIFNNADGTVWFAYSGAATDCTHGAFKL